MSRLKRFRASRSFRKSAARSAIAWILVCGLCALNLPTPAQASNGETTLPRASSYSHFVASTAPDSTPARPAAALRWAPSAEPFPVARPATNFHLHEFDVNPARVNVARYSLIGPSRIYALPRAPLPPSSSGSGRKAWLALGIAGIVVVGIGAGAYAAGRTSFCSGPGKSAGCDRTRDIGLALMPVGGAMAVVGFVMHARH